jgi:hypothetical protein
VIVLIGNLILAIASELPNRVIAVFRSKRGCIEIPVAETAESNASALSNATITFDTIGEGRKSLLLFLNYYVYEL